MDILPFGAIAIGMCAGTLSTFGYVKITPWLNKTVHDTCGVHNLHGMPGLMGGVVSVFAVLAGTAKHNHEGVSEGEQAGKQVFGLLVSLGFAIVGGALTGALCKVVVPPLKDCFEDSEFWEVNEGGLKPSSEADIYNAPKQAYKEDEQEVPKQEVPKQEVPKQEAPADPAPLPAPTVPPAQETTN